MILYSGQYGVKSEALNVFDLSRRGVRRDEDTALSALLENLLSTREIDMARKILVLSLLAMALAAPSTYAQTAPAGTGAPAASAVDPASVQALKNMGAFLQSLKRFHVATEVTGERVLADGQKLQHTATAKMDVERPN